MIEKPKTSKVRLVRNHLPGGLATLRKLTDQHVRRYRQLVATGPEREPDYLQPATQQQHINANRMKA